MDFSGIDLNDAQAIEAAVMSNPKAAKPLFDLVMETEKYKNVKDFSLYVRSTLSIYYAINGMYFKAISEVQDIVKESLELSLWELVIKNYNTLANVYAELYMSDKAFETYQRIIHTSKTHNSTTMLPVAHNNMGILFRSLGDYDRALENFKLAVEYLDNNNLVMYRGRFLNFASNLMTEYSRSKRFNEATELLARIDSIATNGTNKRTQGVILESKSFHYLFKADYKEAENCFQQALPIYLETNSIYNYLATLASYVEQCQILNIEDDHYIGYIIDSMQYFSDVHAALVVRIYKVLINYYKNKNDEENMIKLYPKYTYYMEIYNQVIKTQQLNSINIIFDIEEARAENRLITQQNERLRVLTDEAIANKLELMNAYDKLKIVSEQNATRSEQLQQEVEAHKKTQKKLRALNSHLEMLSSIDGLTGVSNRRLFNAVYSNLLKVAELTVATTTVMMIDINFFKSYNDYYGHLQGDTALISIATTLKRLFDEHQALFARFGGEEFVGVINSLEDANHAEQLAMKLLLAIEALDIKNPAIELGHLSISIGVAYCKAPHVSKKSELLKLADDSLYEAKHSGRNKYIIHILP